MKMKKRNQKQYFLVLLILAVLFIASILRSPITSLGPLIPMIREELGVSNALVGFVNTLPLLAFGLFSPFVPALARRLGMEKVLLLAMLVLSFGIFLRGTGGISVLLFGTFLVGIAIAVGNVLMPGLIKLSFPYRVGLMTGFYSVSMNIFGALASGLSIPITNIEGIDWRSSMQVWSILALIAMLLLILRLPANRETNSLPSKVNNQPTNALFKSKVAWAVTIYMGLQSFIPYSLFTWLPDILLVKGFAEEQTGWFIALFQVGLIPATFLVPLIAFKFKHQSYLALLSGVLFFIGLLGITFISSNLIMLCLLITGVGAGTAFSLAMLFFVLRTNTIEESSQLSSMAQSIGYMIAAIGPIFLGLVAEWTNSWNTPLLILMLASVGIAMCGFVAGKSEKVIVKQH
ncbi:CynX/NimT family MFS transporter [Alkalihalobacillus sp. 1P02AB]|uniref:CynX/NimT family MFS transporter n=1 Tax=Alkalihalobacillus sp. 1P02AB TaxID=3132260 RepID=UPI0039A62218